VNTYDARNQRTRTDGFGTAEAYTTQYSYDLEDRLKTVDPPGAGLRTYIYDEVGRLEDVTEADNPTANVSYTYDALDRVKTETSRGLVNEHTHDFAGNLLTTEYSSGTVVTRTFNNLGLIKTLVDNANRTTTWHYDKAGRARALTLPNGQTQENIYDLKGQLTDRVLKNTAAVVLAAFAWTHDASGNVLTQSETWPTTAARAVGTRTTTMTYHDAGWLDTETITAPDKPVRLTEYRYDDAANREFKIVSENGVVTTSTEYDYNPANQLESWTESNGAGGTLRSALIGFDERRNRDTQTVTLPGGIEKTTQYDWDFQNRLVGVTDPQGGAHAYAYDYRTRRIARSEPGGATAVSWSGGLSLAEYPVTGLQGAVANPLTPQVEYRRGPDMGGGIGGLLHSLRDGAPKYNLGNGRGDVVAQSDQSGALTWTASYEAFGTRPLETGNNADRQRANTKEEDPTGLLWEHFRYRDLETGVWLSRDPAGFVDGPNLYAYVKQNPWTFFDPLGLQKGRTGYRNRSNEKFAANGGWKTVGAGAWAGAGRSVPDLARLSVVTNPIAITEHAVSKLTGHDSAISKTNRAVDSYNAEISSSVANVTGTDANSPNFKGGEVAGEVLAPLPPLAKGAKVLKGALNGVESAKGNLKVTDELIREAMGKSDLAPTQGNISKPIVERDLKMLQEGSEAPPIQTEGGKIVDGHHREIAGQIAGQPPVRTEGTLPSHKRAETKTWDDVEIDEVDYDNP
jgi:RHS repeat-associated protein